MLPELGREAPQYRCSMKQAAFPLFLQGQMHGGSFLQTCMLCVTPAKACVTRLHIYSLFPPK